MRRTDGKHAGGRPSLQKSKDTAYFKNLLREYDTKTLQELADEYSVSKTTICKHIRIAREVVHG